MNYFLAIILVVAVSGNFASSASSMPLDKKISHLLSEYDKNLNVGILVQDAKTAKILYKKNANRYFMPASNEKLFTAFTALQYLGADYTYQTRLYIDKNKIKNGRLDDNVYWQFSGDPTLTIEQLDKLMATLVTAGVQKINGKIVIDDTSFDDVRKSPGTAWDDEDYCWGSPVSALIINRNCVSTKIIPSKINQISSLESPAYPQSMRFVNEVITRSAKTDCIIKIQRTDASTYKISGCIRKTDPAKPLEMAVRSPRRNMQLILNYLFKKNHIEVEKQFAFKKFIFTQPAYAIHESAFLPILVSRMLKDSDNLIADALFKTLGLAYTKKVGSFTSGNLASREILQETVNLPIPKTVLIDGSGTSRYDFLTPQQIVSLLQKIYFSALNESFRAALPISGVDGTLKDRMRDPMTLGKVYAKTGSETAVSSLSGYLETKKKKLLIFSIMINGFIDSPSKYKALEDKLCNLLVEF